MRLTLLRLCLPLLIAGTAGATVKADEFIWVQFVPGGLEARAIAQHATCPPAGIDGSSAAMQVRASADDSFPVLVCATTIPPSADSASIAGVPLALPKSEIRRILVIGDTGCRMKETRFQACNDPVVWPFRLIANAAAYMNPDLVIHVGDYHYRETPCSVGNPGCAGSPSGDTWAVWQADFFSPAKTLLSVAPWVFVRGNHEECDRGGKGWMRALDPRPFDLSYPCAGPAPAFSAPPWAGSIWWSWMSRAPRRALKNHRS